jgi:hypothetical protein
LERNCFGLDRLNKFSVVPEGRRDNGLDRVLTDLIEKPGALGVGLQRVDCLVHFHLADRPEEGAGLGPKF